MANMNSDIQGVIRVGFIRNMNGDTQEISRLDWVCFVRVLALFPFHENDPRALIIEK